MKKIIALILGMLLAVAAQAEPALEAEYEGFGYAELELERDVKWESLRVSVLDGDGTAYDVEILRTDEDELHIRIPMIEDGRTYEVSVSGMAGGETLSCALYADPVKSSMIESAAFDGTDNYLEVNFSFPVVYDGDFSATIMDMNGVEYPVKSIRKDTRSLDIYIDGLALRKSHTLTISGIAANSPEAPAELGRFSETYSIKFTATPPCCV